MYCVVFIIYRIFLLSSFVLRFCFLVDTNSDVNDKAGIKHDVDKYRSRRNDVFGFR